MSTSAVLASATSISPLQVIVAVLCIFATIVFISVMRSKGSSSSSSGTGSLFGGPSRSTLVLCGPPAGGKTTLFQALIHPDQDKPKQTQTSMSVNAGWIVPLPAAMKQQLLSSSASANDDSNVDPNPSNKRFEVVDCPGHMRLFDLTLDAFKTAKVICIVVDGTKVQDSQNGAGSVATLLMNLLTAKETSGVSSILVACNKRDELTSFTAKALQKYVEKEMKQRLSQKAAEVGAARGGGSNLKKSETLSLDENGEFDWASAPRNVSFCDISAKNPRGKFGLGALFEAM